MTRLPQISGRQLIKILQKIGFMVVGQAGSHVKLRRSAQDRIETVIVPDHKVLRKGTLASILRLAGLAREDIEK